MKKYILLGLMVLGLSGCYGATIDYAHDAIKQDLKDPNSAQFEKDTVITYRFKDNDEATIVCGFVNAKNSFGGYVGNKLYVTLAATKDSRPIITKIMDDEIYAITKSIAEEKDGNEISRAYMACVDKMRAVYH